MIVIDSNTISSKFYIKDRDVVRSFQSIHALEKNFYCVCVCVSVVLKNTMITANIKIFFKWLKIL